MPAVSSELEDTISDVVNGKLTVGDLDRCIHRLKENHVGNPRCSPNLMRDLTTIVERELTDHHYQNVATVLSCIQYSATECTENKELLVLLENGLLDLIVFVYDDVSNSVLDQVAPPPAADLCFIQLLEMVNDVTDFDSSTKEAAALLLVEKLMAFIVNRKRNFQTNMEALRTLNLLLEGCSSKSLNDLQSGGAIQKLLYSIASGLAEAGDFEMQVAATETLVRLIKKEDREEFGRKCFLTEAVFESFLSIRDVRFEVDCRTFLNTLNKEQGSERRVFSVPCEKAFLGNHMLKRPQGDQLKEFWVDFNQVSQAITMYVAEEGTTNEESCMWETVTISGDVVKKCEVKKVADLQHLEILLSVPASHIIPFSKSDAESALIVFALDHDLHLPLSACFGSDKVHMQVRRKSSECTIKVLFKRMGEEGGIVTENVYSGSTSTPKRCSDRMVKQEKTKSVSIPLKRNKISAPLVPMLSPLRNGQKDKERSTSSTEKRSSKGENQPRTPRQQPARKRVKTPLNVTVSDKTSLGSNAEKGQKEESIKSTKPKRNTTPKPNGVRIKNLAAEADHMPTEVYRKSDGSKVSERYDKQMSDGDADDEEEGEIASTMDDEERIHLHPKKKCTANSDHDTSTSVRPQLSGAKATSDINHKKSSNLRENFNVSNTDGETTSEGKAKNVQQPQVIPESQDSEMVIQETQEVMPQLDGNHSKDRSNSVIPADSESKSSQSRRNRLARSCTSRGRRRHSPRLDATRGKMRRSPRLEALENLNSLNPGRKQRSQRGKFHLYADQNMLLDDVEEEDVVPSTYPSQDSMADFASGDYKAHSSKETDSKREPANRASRSNIPKKSSEDSEQEGREKPKKVTKRPRKQKVKRSPKSSKSKDSKHKGNNSSLRAVSTLHQTREFLSQSLPVIHPSSDSGDPYLFTDIKDPADEKVKSAQKAKPPKRKCPAKPNLNVPDKEAFLVKKSFMSFPSKSLTGTKTVEHVTVASHGKREAAGEAQRGNDNGEDENGSIETGTEEAHRQKEDHQESDVREITDRRGEERGQIRPSDKHMHGSQSSAAGEVIPIKAGGDGKNRLKGGKPQSRGKHQDKSSDDISFASRETSRIPEIEVMRDIPHFDDDFQDDDLQVALGSLKQFLAQTSKEPVRQQFVSKIQDEKETKLDSKERERHLDENDDNELHDVVEVALEKGERVIKSKHEKKVPGRSSVEDRECSVSGKSSSETGDTLEEIEEELRALSKELQVARQKKKPKDRVVEETKGKHVALTEGRRYGSEIEDDEEEEEVEVTSNLSVDLEDDNKTETSIQSFSRLCKSLVYQSGGAGIAKTRPRRHIAKVDYRDKDTSYSDETYEPLPSEEAAFRQFDIEEQPLEDDHLSSQKRRSSSAMSDKQSEISWLVEKSQVKVSTYSKVKRRGWQKERKREDIFKSTKKTGCKKTDKKWRASSDQLLAPRKKRQKQRHSPGEYEDHRRLYYSQESTDQEMGEQEALIQKISSTGIQPSIDFTPDLPRRSKSSRRSSGETSDDCQVQEITPVTPAVTPAVTSTVTTLSSSFTQPIVPSSSLGKVQNDTEEEVLDVEDDNMLDMENGECSLLSGPRQMKGITKSSLRRKYEHLIDDITRDEGEDKDGSDYSQEDEEADISLNPPSVRRVLNPRRLFETEMKQQELSDRSTTLGSRHDNDEEVEEFSREEADVAAKSSSLSSWLQSSGSPQIPDLMSVAGEKLRKQMAEKKRQTKLLTDAALKTTQNHLSKLWVGQNKRRSTVLQEFRESLLKEIVALDIDMEKMTKATEKLQATMRKMKTLNDTNFSRAISSLHASYIQELGELEEYLSQTLRESLPTILGQELSSLKMKILNDLHLQELGQMKKALNSYLSM